MVYAELTEMVQKKNHAAMKEWFDVFYGKLSGIALRYSKNPEQAQELMASALHNTFNRLLDKKDDSAFNSWDLTRQFFIAEVVKYIFNIRNEYFVSSTVHATATRNSPAPSLFDAKEKLDLDSLDTEVLVQALHKLVPSQRLIFNLHAIDGYSLAEGAEMLESSESTVKSNLEKARYNLQKHIEETLKTRKA